MKGWERSGWDSRVNSFNLYHHWAPNERFWNNEGLTCSQVKPMKHHCEAHFGTEYPNGSMEGCVRSWWHVLVHFSSIHHHWTNDKRLWHNVGMTCSRAKTMKTHPEAHFGPKHPHESHWRVWNELVKCPSWRFYPLPPQNHCGQPMPQYLHQCDAFIWTWWMLLVSAVILLHLWGSGTWATFRCQKESKHILNL